MISPHRHNDRTFGGAWKPAVTVFLILFGAPVLQSQTEIMIDELGYRPGDPKIALIREPISGKFELIDSKTEKSVFSSSIARIGSRDQSTTDNIFVLDFTEFSSPGTYRIVINGSGLISSEFEISDTVFNAAFARGLESFYYQRCGTEVNHGTPWQHPPCHTNDAIFYDNESKRKDVTGGWHDAGDYGKFTSTAALSAAFLLYLYEDRFASMAARDKSSMRIPDILGEVRYELEWLLKMQSADGSVYHKVSTKKWTGERLPQDDPDTRYIFGISTSATGAFAAVTALASRQYAKSDPQFSRELLRAALSAWQFLMVHTSPIPPGGFHNPSDVEGGEYGDSQDDDERLWASVELFRATGSDEYQDYFAAHYQQFLTSLSPISWEQVQNLAYDSYIKIPLKDERGYVRTAILRQMTSYADDLVRIVNDGGYRCILTHDEYYWGSNSIVAGYAFDLVSLYQVTKNMSYLSAAADQLHYLLGRNTFGISFVTGVGSNPVRHPYHQFSMMLHAGAPVPGLLVGGPNNGSRLQGHIISPFPGKCYEDNEKNYFVNEVAINYTAPFVYLAGFFSSFSTAYAAISQKKGTR